MEGKQISPLENTSFNQPKNLCANCQVKEYPEGHSTHLCNDCRELYIKYPIPKWILLFAGFVGILVIVGLVRMPTFVTTAMHLSRSEKYIKEHKYLSAQRELAPVLKTLPDNVLANGRMLIASTYNYDIATAINASAKLEGRNIEDKELFAEMESAMKFLRSTVVTDDTSLVTKIEQSNRSIAQSLVFLDSLNPYSNDYLIGSCLVANRLYDLKSYDTCRLVLEKVLEKDKRYYPALRLMSALKREEGKYDEAISYCDTLLSYNQEDIYAYNQKTRVELKRKHDKEAARFAGIAMALDSADVTAMEAQAMVCFFAGKRNESKALLASIKQKEAITEEHSITDRLSPIINETKTYR